MIKNLWGYSGTRFVAVGIFNTILDFSILNILVFAGGFNKIMANTISVSIAMAVSYLLNKYVVFRHKEEHRATKLVLFVIITAFGLFVLQNGIIYILVHLFTFPGNLATTILHGGLGLKNLSDSFISLNIAKALATAVTLVWNYFMYKQLVFIKSQQKNKTLVS